MLVPTIFSKAEEERGINDVRNVARETRTKSLAVDRTRISPTNKLIFYFHNRQFLVVVMVVVPLLECIPNQPTTHPPPRVHL